MRSPRPVPSAREARDTKKGTSDPSEVPICISSAPEKGCSPSRFIPLSTAAASEEPPPSPAPVRHILPERDPDTERPAAVRGERTVECMCRANGEVLLGRAERAAMDTSEFELDRVAFPGLELETVRKFEKLEDGRDPVVARGLPPEHDEPEIHLRGRGARPPPEAHGPPAAGVRRLASAAFPAFPSSGSEKPSRPAYQRPRKVTGKKPPRWYPKANARVASSATPYTSCSPDERCGVEGPEVARRGGHGHAECNHALHEERCSVSLVDPESHEREPEGDRVPRPDQKRPAEGPTEKPRIP